MSFFLVWAISRFIISGVKVQGGVSELKFSYVVRMKLEIFNSIVISNTKCSYRTKFHFKKATSQIILGTGFFGQATTLDIY